ncbi:MAG: hypothetical protein K2J06_08145 [Muribaculaceae bacterium]|nr:hypothetical protein [Muribaculaceae bacterium]
MSLGNAGRSTPFAIFIPQLLIIGEKSFELGFSYVDTQRLLYQPCEKMSDIVH